MNRIVALSALLAFGCASGPATRGPSVSADAAFAKEAERIYWAFIDANPTFGAALGYHQYDGKLPDNSLQGLKDRSIMLHRAQAALDGFRPAELSDRNRMDREVLLAQVRSALFQLEVRRTPWRDPMSYMQPLDVLNYITRDYAPFPERARSMRAIFRGARAHLDTARANLEPNLPRSFIQIGLIQVNGAIAFAQKDVAEALQQLADPALKQELATAQGEFLQALDGFKQDLERRRAQATDDFALGEASFLRMLADLEGVTIDLPTLERVGQADLERNLRALEAAAAKVAPGKPVREAVLLAGQDRPAPADVVRVATEQSATLRQFLIDHAIVTIPSEDLAEVRESPPFMRFNSAFLRAAGVFEPLPLPSFYFISPPDPKWPEAEQKAYIPPRARLLIITAHEVWPGHFLDRLHRKRHPSPIVRSFGSYASNEGWAHYTEEMMWDEGAIGSDPRDHIAMLVEALTRNVRFLSAIGLHTRGMTVEASTKLFLDKAFTDPGTAKQQAVRGTVDPGYLNYTLGKLMIRKLRDDWKAIKGAAFTLKSFHDTLLSYGDAPLPLVRRAMLGENAGPPL